MFQFQQLYEVYLTLECTRKFLAKMENVEKVRDTRCLRDRTNQKAFYWDIQSYSGPLGPFCKKPHAIIT